MNKWILPEEKAKIEITEQEPLIEKKTIGIKELLEEELYPNYLLIDAALWGTDINILFQDETLNYRSLFRGSTGETLWSVAPYLVDISSNKEFVEVIKKKDPIERRVTWLHSFVEIDELRKHLRRFLRMKKEDDSFVYFRFYDPYVVNAVFPNLMGEQLIDFFGHINYIITEDSRINERSILSLTDQEQLQIVKKVIQ